MPAGTPIAAPAETTAAVPANQPPHASRVVAAAFVIALAALFAIYLAYAVPGKWFSAADPKSFDPRTFAVAVGNGAVDEDALVIAPADASGTIIVTVPATFRAADYPGVAWKVSGLPAGTEARLLWRSEFKPGRTFTLAIPVEADRLAPVIAAREQDWIGPINGIGLALRLPAGEPVRISGVILDTLSAGSLLKGRVRDWTSFEPWNGASINTIVGGADLQELPLPALVGTTVLVATGIAFLLAWWRPQRFGAGLPLALAVMFGAAWFVLDVRWQWNLARQAQMTATAYAGKSWHEKHVVAEDGGLFEFIERVRAKLPRPPARIFMIADAAYFRGRGAYHLYPYNVYFDPGRNTIPPPSALHSGDYIVVYQRLGVQFDPKQGLLRWDGGSPVGADALIVEPGAALFRIR